MQQCLQRGLNFAAFRSPGEQAMHTVAAARVDKRKSSELKGADSGFVVAPFRGDPTLIPADKLIVGTPSEADLGWVTQQESRQANFQEDDNEQLTHGDALDQEAYQELVAQARDTIKEGQFQKLVTSRALYTLPEGTQSDKEATAIAALDALLEAYPQAYVYMMHHEKWGVWVGVTPELLLDANQNRFRTVALAGTKATDRQWTAKEKQEQQWVVDFIADAMDRLAMTQVTTTGPNTIRAGHLSHLSTAFVGQYSGAWQDVAGALHPTPAVCGLPQQKAVAYLLQQEPHDRSLYSGYLGFVSPDQANLYVNIRCAQRLVDHWKLFVGGGITADSDPESEWQETVEKSTTLLSVLENL